MTLLLEILTMPYAGLCLSRLQFTITGSSSIYIYLKNRPWLFLASSYSLLLANQLLLLLLLLRLILPVGAVYLVGCSNPWLICIVFCACQGQGRGLGHMRSLRLGGILGPGKAVHVWGGYVDMGLAVHRRAGSSVVELRADGQAGREGAWCRAVV